MTSSPNSTDRAKFAGNSSWESRQVLLIAFLIGFHTILCCVSLRLSFSYYREAYIPYDGARLYYAIAAVASFALISPLFAFVRFSFGYFAGFYFYTMIVGYLWINTFSQFRYNHAAAGVSAAISAVAFLLPALLITSPIKQRYVLSKLTFERLLTATLLFAVATAAVGAIFNFKLVAIQDIYEFRDQLQMPTLLNYSIGATTSVLLPYLFACFLALKKPWQTGAVLLVALSFYPITLSKLTLFAPVWLVALAALSKISGTILCSNIVFASTPICRTGSHRLGRRIHQAIF